MADNQQDAEQAVKRAGDQQRQSSTVGPQFGRTNDCGDAEVAPDAPVPRAARGPGLRRDH